jgi:tRNA A37 methylthiotransferase MiaB
VHESEVSKRARLFTGLAKRGKADYARRWLGREVEVIVEKSKMEKEQKIKYCSGVSENYLKALVLCKEEVPPPGTLLRCRLLEKGKNEYDVAAEEVLG